MGSSVVLGVAVLCAVAFPGMVGSAVAAPRIVVFGDSLTSGHGIGKSNAYPAILQERLNNEGFEFEVVNAGVTGATSADGVLRLRAALAGNVRVLIVAFGANDGVRGVPAAQLRSNLSRIIREAQARRVKVLLCGMEALPVHGAAYSVAFHRVYRELASRFHVPLVPFLLANVIGNDSTMQRDRVHPNISGARLVAENIWPYLKPLIDQPVAIKQ